mmetsp:Transcript_2708/g.4421  ORF Transcript_2708/g.4421 Transcript_2708/m.4421 type:complete len:596 (-) Transcript_2708:26-1813(-)
MEQKANESESASTPGIVSIECYFPKLYIDQTEFEQYNNESSGKYTIGLGQKEMAFTSDREDICSISMTVLSNLLSKNHIDYHEIGWICVATETIIDHSKSVSSMLMDIFHQRGNYDIEGIDVKHACYAGTFALFTAFDRISSKYWDGKYCIVIAADIAEYEQGPARCTGGCGAVALLIGNGGCIDLNVLRASYKAHEYDFYKPHLNSPYPVVNGHVSNACYLNAFDSCLNSYRKKANHAWTPVHEEDAKMQDGDEEESKPATFAPDYWVFHAPYNKLVSKTFGRVVYHHFLSNPEYYYSRYANNEEMLAFLRKYEKVSYKETINARDVIKRFEKISKEFYNSYVAPSAFIPQSIGNCYTASIFMGLMSLIYKCADDLEHKLVGKNIQMFSYGSGTLASLYSLKVMDSPHSLKLLQRMVENNDIEQRFAHRTKIPCDQYTTITNEKQIQFHSDGQMVNDFVPTATVDHRYFYSNTYYLSKIDTKKQRFYEKFEYKMSDLHTELEENTGAAINENDEITPNIARFKVDDEDEQETEKAAFRLPNIGQFAGDVMLKESKKLLKNAEDYGLSKKGAIKIDKIINSAHDATTAASKCSNS